MDIKTVKERIQKNQERKAKVAATLDKYIARKAKLLATYKADTEACKVIPYEVFDNFRYIGWKEQRETGVTDYNAEYQKRLYALRDSSEIYKDLFYRLCDYSWKMTEIIEGIHNKEEQIKEIEESIEKLNATATSYSSNDELINKVFDKVPELQEFLNACGEKIYAFDMEANEKLKKAWKKYYEIDSKYCDMRNNGKLENGTYYKDSGMAWSDFAQYAKKFYKEQVLPLKPKKSPLSEEMIRKNVENWKRSEALLMADRLKTEFGDIVSADLHLGDDGNVNGIIKGTEKSAKLETIWAGGYNIQKLHTRLLFHEF